MQGSPGPAPSELLPTTDGRPCASLLVWVVSYEIHREAMCPTRATAHKRPAVTIQNRPYGLVNSRSQGLRAWSSGPGRSCNCPLLSGSPAAPWPDLLDQVDVLPRLGEKDNGVAREYEANSRPRYLWL